MKRVIFTNQKGGVGKTTLTREIGIALAAAGHRVLLIDSDPQGNLSKSLTDSEGPGLYAAFEEGRIEPVEVRRNLDVLCGDQRLAALEKRYLGEVDAYGKLSALFEEGSFEDYELVMIDSPPSLGIMTLNGLAAADCFVIPLRPALYSLQGTNDLLHSVAKVRKSLNPRLELLGVILNDYLPGPVISAQIREEIADSFGQRVFATVVCRTVKIEEAIATRLGVVETAEGRQTEKSHKIVCQVQTLAQELLQRLEPGRSL